MSRKLELCSKHYHRLLRHGDTETIGKKGRPRPELMNTPETFWANVQIGAQDSCWPWLGSTVGRGYGSMRWVRKPTLSHRLAFYLTHGEWPPVVMHTCDNPPCCNPGHLQPGTNMENTQDCIAKRRFPRGSGSGMAKINEEVVMEMRGRTPYWGCQTAWAKEFGIDQTTISEILAGKTWKHVVV